MTIKEKDKLIELIKEAIDLRGDQSYLLHLAEYVIDLYLKGDLNDD